MSDLIVEFQEEIANDEKFTIVTFAGERLVLRGNFVTEFSNVTVTGKNDQDKFTLFKAFYDSIPEYHVSEKDS